MVHSETVVLFLCIKVYASTYKQLQYSYLWWKRGVGLDAKQQCLLLCMCMVVYWTEATTNCICHFFPSGKKRLKSCFTLYLIKVWTLLGTLKNTTQISRLFLTQISNVFPSITGDRMQHGFYLHTDYSEHHLQGMHKTTCWEQHGTTAPLIWACAQRAVYESTKQPVDI